MKRRLVIDRLDWRLGAVVTALVLVVMTIGFYVLYEAYRGEVLGLMRRQSESNAKLIRVALERRMLDHGDDGTVGREIADTVARMLPYERLMILDRHGLVAFSTDNTIEEHHFDIADATCQACHERAPDQRQRSVLLRLPGDRVLRTVLPLPNTRACHECHDPSHHMNGVLIFDQAVGGMLDKVKADVRQLAAGTAVVAMLLILGLGVLFRRLVLARLYRFEATARAIARGDLDQRVPVEGNDALTRLERRFNAMADSVGGLLQRVRGQQRRMQRILNSVDDGVIVLDRHHVVIDANRAMAHRFQSEVRDFMDKPCWRTPLSRTCSCGGREAALCAAANQLGRDEPSTEIRAVRDIEGRLRHHEVRTSAISLEGTANTHVVEVWRDITERRGAEARLADYQRMASVGMLASGLAHELNTPLASIASCLRGIRRSCGPGADGELARDRVAEYAEIAREQVERCTGVTRQFLGLVRRGGDRQVLDPVALAAEVARLARIAAREAEVRIEVAERTRVPSVVAPAGAPAQVLLNLVMNAIQASEVGSVVSIDFRPHGEAPRAMGTGDRGDVEILVRDRGRGMSEAEAARVFEPFFSRREGGTGIGLFVSLGLARRWGGDLEVLETEPGRGTTMAMSFGLAPAGTGPGPEAPVEKEHGGDPPATRR